MFFVAMSLRCYQRQTLTVVPQDTSSASFRQNTVERWQGWRKVSGRRACTGGSVDRSDHRRGYIWSCGGRWLPWLCCASWIQRWRWTAAKLTTSRQHQHHCRNQDRNDATMPLSIAIRSNTRVQRICYDLCKEISSLSHRIGHHK